ncbi:hypothetical protein L0P88_07415 [Muricauda sp. SCSIO 64092]|uniref:hypothetical protein n=1 Tax=Allomuricauda sp. SCSIO 64092 TaxID=2908842 RepID=UPI001FF56821|nr:hypothetical protein [Muricauda sp. SCSIO 64092]UOY08377.1 hypothetical protein L0P88_07415 [Muricauda sp. SCSIO 64092]
MKTTFTYFLISCIALFTFSCSSYQAKKQEALLSFPELGAIVKVKDNLWYSATEQVGLPQWTQLRVTAQEMPFNRESYFAYAKATHRAGKINSIPYMDSLQYKPKYIRLQLLDKIEITELLNTTKNRTVRSYLEKDGDLKMVTSVDLALSETEITFFNQAEAFELRKDDYGTVILNIVDGGTEQAYYLSDLRVFNYGYSSFCWGEDQYHRLQIEHIAPEGEKCPKGTYTKPDKVKANQSYVKF